MLETFIVFTLILTPLIIGIFLLKKFECQSKNAITNYLNEQSEIHYDLKVWIKNFDIFQKKRMFEFSPFTSNYDFYECDLVINPDNLIIIGKTKVLGKRILLNPTIIGLRNGKKSRIKEIGTDLEIDFLDPLYTNKMTLVIKQIDDILKEKIKSYYTEN